MERVDQIPYRYQKKRGIFRIQIIYCVAYYHTQDADSLRNIDPLKIRHLVLSCSLPKCTDSCDRIIKEYHLVSASFIMVNN